MKKIILTLLVLAAAQGAWADQYGRASFYGDQFQGRLTASGEVFDQGKLTAAHRTLAFGTKVRVTNLANNRQIEVVINDRGPFVQGRIIDLSKSAAESLDMITAGTVPVKMELITAEATPGPLAIIPLPPPPRDETPEPPQTFPTPTATPISAPASTAVRPSPIPAQPSKAEIFIQTGSFQDRTKAQSAARKLKSSGFNPQIWEQGGYFRVGVPGLKKEEGDFTAKLKKIGITAVFIRSSVPPGKSAAF